MSLVKSKSTAKGTHSSRTNESVVFIIRTVHVAPPPTTYFSRYSGSPMQTVTWFHTSGGPFGPVNMWATFEHVCAGRRFPGEFLAAENEDEEEWRVSATFITYGAHVSSRRRRRLTCLWVAFEYSELIRRSKEQPPTAFSFRPLSFPLIKTVKPNTTVVNK